MEDLEIRELLFGDGYGFGSGSGNGYGYGFGSGSGFGGGDGFGSGSGSGYGFGSGDGSGDGGGYGSGSGDGDGGGDGGGGGYGFGSGDGDGYGIQSINGKTVYKIDGVQTVIDHIHGSIAKGGILMSDLTIKKCFVVKSGMIFAHGDTLREAYVVLAEKLFDGMSEDERMPIWRKS